MANWYSLISTEEALLSSPSEGGTKEGTARPPVIKSIALETRRDFPDPLYYIPNHTNDDVEYNMYIMNGVLWQILSQQPHLSPVTATKHASGPKSTSISISSPSLTIPAILDDLMETM